MKVIGALGLRLHAEVVQPTKKPDAASSSHSRLISVFNIKSTKLRPLFFGNKYPIAVDKALRILSYEESARRYCQRGVRTLYGMIAETGIYGKGFYGALPEAPWGYVWSRSAKGMPFARWNTRRAWIISTQRPTWGAGFLPD